MEKLLLSEAAAFVGGALYGEDLEFDSVSTDTRTIEAGSLFIPLKGGRFDAHDFLEEAVLKGAAAVFSEKPDLALPVPYILVHDTNEALLTLASRYKERFNVKTVGITGSVGKTTTKEMTAAILSGRFKTLKTEGNLNNFIGLPLSVLKLDRTYDAAVFEMGMSGFGEISKLTRVAKPDAAIITAIGVSHIEYLGSREGILKAKLEILEGLRPGGIALLNGDEPMLYGLRDSLPCKTVFFGRVNPKSDVFADNIRETPQGLRFTVTTNSLRFDADLNVIGRHNINDALAAISAAVYFGLSEREIIEGLASFRNVGMRQNIYRKSGMTIIEDCYNASPESVLAAMQVLKGISTEGRRFLILGGMRELGDYAQKGHFDCGREAAAAADFLYVFGENAEYYIEGAKKAGMNTERIRRFATKSELAKTLAQTALPGDVLLIKGSRAMKMEEVTGFLFGERKNEV